ncbi:metallophosphoesterase [Halococcus sp. AFM35]|uniref:metallophosphoesterase n=1 Tax=Halococcus sp. AFM35 TaxID=3421653 RepID=UPI003EBA0D1F
MTVIIHTSDTHLGYHQYHLSQRAVDFRLAFKQIVDAAIERDVDAVVHAGDFFHDSNPAVNPILDGIAQLRRLKQADIPFLTVVGNHDTTRGKQWVNFFEAVADGTHLGHKPVCFNDVAIYGLDYVPPSKRDQLEYDFDPHDCTHAVLVAHGLFKPLTAHGDWSLPDILSSSTVSFDAALLGDDHAPKHDDIGGTFATYPGSTERTAADQRGDRRFTILRFGNDAGSGETEDCPPGISHEEVPLDVRKHEYIDIEADEDMDVVATVRDELRDRDVQDAVAVITISGEGDPVTVAPLEEFGDEQGALVTRVSDRRRRGVGRVAVDVSFADPDEAVERRLRTLGLSSVVADLEQQARGDDPKTSNLTDVIEETINDCIEEDAADFEPTEPELTLEELRAQADDGEGMTLDTTSTSQTPSMSDGTASVEESNNDEEVEIRTDEGSANEEVTLPGGNGQNQSAEIDEQSSRSTTTDEATESSNERQTKSEESNDEDESETAETTSQVDFNDF